MEAKETIYRSKVRRIMGPMNGLLTLGFGSAAIFSGLDQQYILSVSEAVTALGFGYEMYNNIRYGTRDGRGYIAAALGSMSTVLNSPYTEGFNFHGVVGNVGIPFSVINGFATLGHKLNRRDR